MNPESAEDQHQQALPAFGSPLPPQAAYNWEQLQLAASENRLMVWRMPRHSDGAPLFVVCSTTRTDSEMKLEPLALLFDGDPRDVIEGKSPHAGN